jgi:hypothetical protein
MTVQDLGDITVAIGGVAISLLAIGALVRWLVLRPLKNWISQDFAPKILEPLHAVKDEVTENQGRSLKDAVTRVEARVGTLDKRFGDHITLHGQVLKTEGEPDD